MLQPSAVNFFFLIKMKTGEGRVWPAQAAHYIQKPKMVFCLFQCEWNE